MRMGGSRCLAIIPARGGSKSIPLKNIRPLGGKPLLAYTIEAAKQSRYLDRCVVSTDHAEIAKVASEYGAEVYTRPADLATDEAPTEWTLLHVLEVLEKDGYCPDIVVTLEPTSPLRTARLIDQCIEAVLQGNADSVLTVKEVRACMGRISNRQFEFLIKNQPRRRQDREPLYQESSTVYVTKTDTLLRRRSVLGDRLKAVVVSDEEAVDINTPLDLVIAEAVLRWKHEGAHRHD